MKLIILDRDGVINFDSDQFIKSPEEWRPIPGSLEAIARLNQAGYRVAVATNQSGVGRGLFDMATLNAMNDKMMEMVFRQGGRIDAHLGALSLYAPVGTAAPGHGRRAGRRLRRRRSGRHGHVAVARGAVRRRLGRGWGRH